MPEKTALTHRVPFSICRHDQGIEDEKTLKVETCKHPHTNGHVRKHFEHQIDVKPIL